MSESGHLPVDEDPPRQAGPLPFREPMSSSTGRCPFNQAIFYSPSSHFCPFSVFDIINITIQKTPIAENAKIAPIHLLSVFYIPMQSHTDIKRNKGNQNTDTIYQPSISGHVFHYGRNDYSSKTILRYIQQIIDYFLSPHTYWFFRRMYTESYSAQQRYDATYSDFSFS